jgi:hypothetical protein
MAGVLDGEGTITVVASLNKKTGNRGVSCRLLIANSNQPLMSWVRANFGGKLYAPRASRLPIHKPMYTWYINGEPALAVIRLVMPYLRVKSRQAELLLALGDLQVPRGKRSLGVPRHLLDARAPLLAELRALNHRGLVA